MLIDDVLKCSFDQWYPIFGHLSIESEIIKLDQKFCDYILSDGIVLPESCNSEFASSLNGHDNNGNNNNNNEIQGDNHSNEWNNNNNNNNVPQPTEESGVGEEEDDDVEDIPVIEFPKIEKQIRQCLQRFGHVFPKLNWSSCEDASWIQATGTKCSDLTSVFLLLKSSDKIVHDLTEPFEHCSDYDGENPPPESAKIEYELVLRKWINMNPSMEFRCFCLNNKLIGICQRDVRTYYDYVQKEMNDIINDIETFFNQEIAGKFTLNNFVIDILRPNNATIILIDFNVFGELTDSLLFDWNELRNPNLNNNDPSTDPNIVDFRYIQDQFGVQRSRFQLNSLPLDVFNGNITNLYDDNLNDQYQ